MTGDEQFYSALAEIEAFADIADRGRYAEVPASWHLVITDVKGSTAAIEAGRYRDVNAIGVASIVAVRNAMADLEIPYVFGGDGATMLVPAARLDAARSALRGTKRVARDSFQLDLRAGVVPIAELFAEQQAVRVARFRVSPSVRLAMFGGSGIAAAEKRIKDPALGPRYEVGEDGDATVSFEGFECRWQPIHSRRGNMVSLLVMALAPGEEESATVYRQVIELVERVAQLEATRPVTQAGLRLRGAFDDYSVEARVRSGAGGGEALAAARSTARKKSLIGRVLMGLRASAGGFDGARYKAELVANTDFRKFDETLRMVLDLSEQEQASLRAELERRRQAGQLAFGIHTSPAALVTCFVRAYAGDHVHFVDGADGGYALAAKELKAQLRARAASAA